MSQPKYNTESLLESIAHAKRNIKALELAIEKERQTIRDYRSHVAHNEKQAAIKTEIVVVAERDEDQ